MGLSDWDDDKPALEEAFNKMDKDGNGKISNFEMCEFWAEKC